MAFENLCMYCFEENGGADVCPHCGRDARAAVPQIQLLPGTLVYNERFLIGRALGQDASGIVYAALDTRRNVKIRIREYLPRDCARRLNSGEVVPEPGMEDQFEAGMRKLRASVEGVEDPAKRHFFFEENGTGYIAQRKNAGAADAGGDDDGEHPGRRTALVIGVAAALVLGVAIGVIALVNYFTNSTDTRTEAPKTSGLDIWQPPESPTPTPYASATFAAITDPTHSWMDFTNPDLSGGASDYATPTPAPTPTGGMDTSTTISSKSSTETIKKLQSLLVNLGWLDSSGVTGKYDDATRQAVKDFQQYMNDTYGIDPKLSVDGVAGPKTLTWLLKTDVSMKPTPTPAPVTPSPTQKGQIITEKSSAEEIKYVQLQLARLGILSMDDVNGTYDEKTRKAVLAFQQRVNDILQYDALDEDGVCGDRTLAYLDYYVDWWEKNQPTPAPTASAIPATVSVERLVIYEKASTGSAKLGTLQKGDTLNVQAISGSWARVEKGGRIGYCKKAGLTPTADVTPEPSASATVEPTATPDVTEVKFQATVVSATMTVYAASSTSSAQLGTLKAGTLVDVYAYEGDWAYIGVGDKRGFAKISCMSGSSYQELSTGDSGDAVQKLNVALLKLGYYDAIPSSKYDSATTAAVKRLQAAMNEAQTGTAGAALQRIIYAGNAPKSPILSMSLSKGDAGTNVQRIQQRLYALGYLSKSASVDADYGATTQKAVSLFQKAAGMTESGKADSSVIQKLYSASAPKLPSGTNPADVAETPAEDPDKGSTDNSPLSSEGRAKVETIVAAAKEKLGCKYVFASTGPNTFDCSGLVKYCYSKVGISIPHSAYSIGYGSATKIAYSGLVRGDIVCLNTLADSDLSDHVGIYLGGGQFIHASSGKAQVIISDLTSGYYNRVFSWGKRYIH